MEPAKWDTIAQNWDTIPEETYKFLFSQAKERYDEIMSESQAITEKSLNLAKITLGALTGFVGYNLSLQIDLAWVIILSLFYVVNLFCLSVLLFPKNIVFRGSPPNELFCNYLDNPEYNDGDKKRIVYYHELIRYQDRIDTISKKNGARQGYYASSLILTIITATATALIIISSVIGKNV